MDVGRRIDVERDIACLDIECAVERWDVWSERKVFRRQIQEKVVHRGVTDDHQLEDVLGR